MNVRSVSGEVGKGQRDSHQLSLERSWDKKKLLSSMSHEYKQLTKSVTYCLAHDMLPISTVDKPGFQAMLHKFNIKYHLPSHNHFMKVSIPLKLEQLLRANR